MIHFDGEEIAVRNSRGYAGELSDAGGFPTGVADQWPIRYRKEIHQRRRARINRDRSRRPYDPPSRVVIGDEGDGSDAFEFAQSLVAAEEKGFVLDDRAADRRAELIPAEFRFPTAAAIE